nr:MAG TPA_asm: hypothetical protein [Caudoviricetes sp.]
MKSYTGTAFLKDGSCTLFEAFCRILGRSFLF